MHEWKIGFGENEKRMREFTNEDGRALVYACKNR
jgi:hypothetical protein